MKAEKFIDAEPYKWPYNGDLRPDNTCIIVIDMQVDFCAPYVCVCVCVCVCVLLLIVRKQSAVAVAVE